MEARLSSALRASTCLSSGLQSPLPAAAGEAAAAGLAAAASSDVPAAAGVSSMLPGSLESRREMLSLIILAIEEMKIMTVQTGWGKKGEIQTRQGG